MSDTSDVTREIPAPTVAPPAEATTRMDVIRRPFGPPQLVLAFVAVAAAAFLVGIIVATATKPASNDDVLASRVIGPEGGTLRFEGGQATFPAGALSRRTEIVVSGSTIADRLRVNHEDGPIVIDPGSVTAYTFEPADMTFAKPVELTFRLKAGSRNGSVFTRRGNDIVLLSGTVDPARATATTRVRDFSFGGS